MRFHVVPLVGLAALALGCAGGQTGDLSGNTETGGGNSAGGCIERRQKLGSFDEQTEFGSAEQVLAYAEGSFEAPLTWRAPGEGQTWSAGPETGESRVVIEVARGQSAYLLTYEPEANDSGIQLGVGCPPPQLGVEAQVTVVTDGGALNESFETLLRTGSAGLATLQKGLDASSLGGTLELSSSAQGGKLVQLGLSATLMPEGTTGSLTALEQVDTGSVSGVRGALLAVWPDDPACAAADGPNDGGGIGKRPGELALGLSGDAAAELLSSMTPVTVRWRDGSSAELTLETALLGDGCLRATNGFSSEPGGSITYPARFALSSDDGRLQGAYTGTVVAFPEGDGHGVTAQAIEELSVERIAESGFAEATVPSGVERLTVWFEARRVGDLAQGALRLSGITDPPCVTDPAPPLPDGAMGSPGCAGSTVTPIEGASWGPP